MAGFIQSEIKHVDEGDVIFTKDDVVKADSNLLLNDSLTESIRDFLIVIELYHLAMDTIKQNIDDAISALKRGDYDYLGVLLSKMKESCEAKE